MDVSPHNRCAFGVIGIVLFTGCVAMGTGVTCYACEYGIEEPGGNETGIEVNESSLEISVSEDGDAEWRIRSNLSRADYERLQNDSDRLERLVHRAVLPDERGFGGSPRGVHDGRIENISGTLRSGHLVITFSQQDVGDRQFGGVLLVDAFHVQGGKPTGHPLGTDSVTLRGPPGTVVTNDPPGGTVTANGTAVVWQEPERISGETYVTFDDDRNAVTRSTAELAIAADVLRWLLPYTLIGLPVSILFLALGILLHGWARPDSERASRSFRNDVSEDDQLAVTVAGIVGVLVLSAVDAYGFIRALVVGWSTLLVPIVLFGALGWWASRNSRQPASILALVAAYPLVVATADGAQPSGPNTVGDPSIFLALFTVMALIVGLPSWYIANRTTSTTAEGGL